MESPAESPVRDERATVEILYGALVEGELGTVARLLAPDLEWWFHGPPQCQHMKRLLTGASARLDFRFVPRRITPIGGRIFVEGWEGARVYWAHVWTLRDGVITQFREYFNTWLTVRDLSVGPFMWEPNRVGTGTTLWRSGPMENPNGSFPEIVLAI
ncbi:hypothetical protein H6P81_008073 [Aristolochia fimbriata]|uniref:Wound-induced protein 1 n=1 Tax=Aristolochia fimbriata TaxID=158543 RepID=A0AAV7F3D0_ARIFI|nr:hypothetical protein H6P81_008073 [Aristolochia fimbriata]